MHVLPLPFGLALAVLPRHEARLIRAKEDRPFVVRRYPGTRDRILADLRYADSRQHIV